MKLSIFQFRKGRLNRYETFGFVKLWIPHESCSFFKSLKTKDEVNKNDQLLIRDWNIWASFAKKVFLFYEMNF